MQITNMKLSGIIPAKECYIELYDQYFYVLFGESNLIKLRDFLQDNDFIFKNARGMVVYNEESGSIYLWFPDRKYIRVSEGTLAHEIVHVMDFISINKEINHDTQNQEVYAQLMGYLFRNLLPLFNKK